MARKKSLVFLALLLLFQMLGSFTLEAPDMTADPVVIYSVSTSFQDPSDGNNRKGSIYGGTEITIKVSGIDLTFANNLILVGSYPCDIPAMGINGVYVRCVTRQPQQSDVGKWLPVTINVLTKENGTSTCFPGASCNFRYDESFTPRIHTIVPNAQLPGLDVWWLGIYRVLDTGLITKLLIGDQMCDRFQLKIGESLNLNDGEVINPNDYTWIPCSTSSQGVGGRYDTSIIQKYGLARHYQSQQQVTVDGTQTYHFTVVPAVDSLNQHVGSEGGAYITIQGQGFSEDKDQIQVNVGDLDCEVQSSTLTSIECKLEAGASTANPLNVQGSGLQFAVYPRNNRDASSFRTAYLNNQLNDADKLTTFDFIPTPEILRQLDNYCAYFVGYFKAPFNGDYRFFSAADDNLWVDFNNEKILQTWWRPYRTYYQYYNYLGETVSEYKTLTAGQLYPIQAFFCQNGGGDYFTLSVEVPNPNGATIDSLCQTAEDSLADLSQKNQDLQACIADANCLNQADLQQLVDDAQVTYNTDFLACQNAYPVNSVSEIQKLEILYTNRDYETWQITVCDPDVVFRFRFKGTQPGLPLDDTWTWNSYTDSYKESDWTIQRIQDNFNSHGGWKGPQASKQVDGNGCSVWTVEFHSYRYQTGNWIQLLAVQSDSDSTITTDKVLIQQVQLPSPPIRGTFQLSFGGTLLSQTFNYDSPSSIVSNMRFQFVNYDFNSWWNGNADDGFEIYIEFKGDGYRGNVPQLVLETSTLTGGVNNNSIVLEISTLREGSSKYLFEPISQELLVQADANTHLTVNVNGVLGLCTADCSYSTSNAQTPTLIAYQFSLINGLTGFDVKLGGNAQTGSNVIVEFGRKTCTINADGTCDLPQTDAQDAFAIEAGQFTPIVLIKDIGYAVNSARLRNLAISSQTIAISLTSLSAPSGSLGGGQPLTIVGNYFPESLGASVIEVWFGANKAEVLSLTNTEIEVITPAGAATGTIQVTVDCPTCGGNVLSNALDYEYITAGVPFITGLDKNEASPVLKGFLTITGQGFGSDENAVEVIITSPSSTLTVYRLGIYSISDTEIIARLGGGRTGNYQIRVKSNSLGFNLYSLNPNGNPITYDASIGAFAYNIKVTSISPNTGSNGGGTVVTISGHRFSTITTQNQVFIGDQPNIMCRVQSATETQIVCITDAAPTESMYAGESGYGETPQTVVVVGRLLEDAICESTCTFTYLGSSTPTLTSIDNNQLVPGTQYTLTGTQFNGNSKVVLNGVKYAATTASSTSITFFAPQLTAGSYQLQVYIDNLGYSVEKLTVTISESQAFTVTLNNNAFSTGDISIDVTLSQSANNPTFNLRCKSCSSQQSNALGYSVTENNNAFTTGTISFTAVAAGNYELYVKDSQNKYGISGQITVSFTGSPALSQSTSSQGGSLISITGLTGLPNGQGGSVKVKVCGQNSQIVSTLSNQLNIKTPPLSTKAALQTLRNSLWWSGGPEIDLTDEISITSNPADNNIATTITDTYDSTFFDSDDDQCQILFDFGSYSKAYVTGITIRPYVGISGSDLYQFKGAVFQGSDDNSAWTTIHTLDYTIHSGDNIFKRLEELAGHTAYRYIRLAKLAGDTGSCRLARIRLFGFIVPNSFSDSLSTDTQCSVTLNVNGATQNLGTITYDQDITPVLTDVQPRVASWRGGDVVTLTGTFSCANNNDAQVKFDGVTCLVTSCSATTIVCTTGEKTPPPAECNTRQKRSIEVSFGGFTNFAAFDPNINFFYGLLWSDEDTWGAEPEPQEGDLVYVPICQTLIVDQTPIGTLNAVVVEGSLVWADKADYTFDAYYIISRKGEIYIGQEGSPYQHKLVITLHGNEWGVQFPMFGNKCIVNHQGVLDIHGQPKTPTWTDLAQDVTKNSNTLTLVQAVNWQVGDLIVIASTDFNMEHAETFKILAISPDKLTITIDGAFQYDHAGHIEQYQQGGVTQNFPFRAEVAVLTRNVVIQGDADSAHMQYGYHLMNHGDGLKAIMRLSHFESINGGQPKILGRYPIHYHLNGDVRQSYAIGNAVHHSHARTTTIHGVHYLYYAWNIGYDNQGHNVFLEDGVETEHIIEYNLMIKSRQVWFMLQTDVTVASYWITHPKNYFRHNRAAGSFFYGYWYEIKQNPDGPSSSDQICPRGEKLSQFFNNTAHSNGRFGLRILEHAHRAKPCESVRNNWAINPFYDNPSISQSVYERFTTFRNLEAGILAEFVGNSLFKDILIADSFKAGFQAHVANLTQEDVYLVNATIVGISQQFQDEWVLDYPTQRLPGHKDDAAAKLESYLDMGEAATNAEKRQAFFLHTRGIITPKTDGFVAQQIRFHNFDTGMDVIQSCSECHSIYLWVMGAKTTTFSDIQVYNSDNAHLIYWERHRREIFLFTDGSFGTSDVTGVSGNHWVIPYWPHNNVPECYHTNVGDIDLNDTNSFVSGVANDRWDNSHICANLGGKEVTVRKIQFTNPVDEEIFTGIDLRVYNLHGHSFYNNQGAFNQRSLLDSSVPFDQAFGKLNANRQDICQCEKCVNGNNGACTQVCEMNPPPEVGTCDGLTFCQAKYTNADYDTDSAQAYCYPNGNPNKANTYYSGKVHCLLWGCSLNMKIKKSKDTKKAFAVPVVTGYIYNMHWKEGIDWTHFTIDSSTWWAENENPIVIRFNHTDNREMWDIYKMLAGSLYAPDQNSLSLNDPTKDIETTEFQALRVIPDDKLKFYPNNNNVRNKAFAAVPFDQIVQNNRPNPNCKNGEYYADAENQLLYVCVSGKGKTRVDGGRRSYDLIDLNAVRCRETCPRPQKTACERDEVISWTNAIPFFMTKEAGVDDLNYQVAGGVFSAGLDVLIPFNLNINLDTNDFNGENELLIDFKFNTLTIDGALNLDIPAGYTLNIRAKWIWVRRGELIAGSANNRIKGNINIELIGGRFDPYLFLDDRLEISNKVLLNTGDLQLFGDDQPSGNTINVWTRLTSNINNGDTQITVEDTTGWQVGDVLAIGPSNYVATEHEKVTITGINHNTKTVQVTPAIQYFHYGDTIKTVSNDQANPGKFGQYLDGHSNGLDMRTAVGHLTRNIKIFGEDRDQWGGRVVTYEWTFVAGLNDPNLQPEDLVVETNTGRTVLDYVELFNVGQRDTANSGVDFRYISVNRADNFIPCGDSDQTRQQRAQEYSIVTNCGIHSMTGWGVRNEDSSYLNVINNVVYDASKFLVRSLNSKHVHIENNLLINARKRDLPDSGITDEVACVYAWTNYIPSDDISVKNNICQGSEDGFGFAIPMTNCQDVDQNAFSGNMAGQTNSGFVYEPAQAHEGEGSVCMWAGDNAAYRSKRGFIVNPTTSGIIRTEKIIAAETHGGLVSKSANSELSGLLDLNNNLNLQQSYTSDSLFIGLALARDCANDSPNCCKECYESDPSNLCNNIYGNQIYFVTQSGEHFPFKKEPASYDALCNPTALDMASFFEDVQFVNFKVNYGLQICDQSNNFAFKTKSDCHDAIAPTFLTNVNFDLVDEESKVFIDPPVAKHRGWFGGCGDFPLNKTGFDCNGPRQVLVYDIDRETAFISNNREVGDVLSNCIFSSYMNSYKCLRNDITIVEFQAFGEENPTRWKVNQKDMFHPVYLAYDQTGELNNTLNAWREWDWFGCCEPLNARMMRFTALITLNQVYNVSYFGRTPNTLEHRLALRNPQGEPDKWVIWKLKWHVPQMPQVTVQGVVVKPFRVHKDDPSSDTDLSNHLTTCGAHNYYYWNYTIHFVFNGALDCVVKISLTNNVYITSRFIMPATQFFNDGYDSEFIDRVQTLLGLDTSQLKIVGVVSTTSDQDLADSAPPANSFGRRRLQGTQVVDIILAIMGGPLSPDPETLTEEQLNDPNYYNFTAELEKIQTLKDYVALFQQSVQDGTLDLSDLAFDTFNVVFNYKEPKDPFGGDDIEKPGDNSTDDDSIFGDKDSLNSSSSGDDSTIYIIIAVVLGVLFLAVVVGVLYLRGKKKHVPEIISEDESPDRPRTPDEQVKKRNDMVLDVVKIDNENQSADDIEQDKSSHPVNKLYSGIQDVNADLVKINKKKI